MNGILLIDKPKGITSYDVIRSIKPFFPPKYKIGHAGTLDPFATGLLIILVGKATKQMDRILSLHKKYSFIAEFGYSTDTQDITGEVICRDDKRITEEEIKNSCESMIGEYMQQPPIYSAKKINGTASYKLARQGENPVLEKKKVEIFSFNVKNYNWPKVSFEATVSSGTYVRTLVIDLASMHKTYATTIQLTRNAIGKFRVEDSINIEDISPSKIKDNLISIEKLDEYFN